MSVLDRFKLNGKTALVTGGARGLGKTMATALAEAGANIAITGRSLESCEGAAKEIAQATGTDGRAFAGDVRSRRTSSGCTATSPPRTATSTS
jgi:NAD(P)-dependent dehydrogenase (short-subunit alcohol dehydrogenase family)